MLCFIVNYPSNLELTIFVLAFVQLRTKIVHSQLGIVQRLTIHSYECTKI